MVKRFIYQKLDQSNKLWYYMPIYNYYSLDSFRVLVVAAGLKLHLLCHYKHFAPLGLL